jgi:hypothetical protein
MTGVISGTSNSTCITTTGEVGTSISANYLTIGEERIRISNSSGYITPGFNSFNLNTSNMISQIKVAVFTVKRSEETQNVTSTQLLKEMWVEVKPNADLKLVVASKLSKEDLQGADLSDLDIRVLQTMNFS